MNLNLYEKKEGETKISGEIITCKPPYIRHYSNDSNEKLAFSTSINLPTGSFSLQG